MQRSYVNHAMHDLHSLNKIFISIFETEYETSVSYTHLTLPTKLEV